MDRARLSFGFAVAVLLSLLLLRDAAALPGPSAAGSPPSSLTGVYDVQVHEFYTYYIYHCIAYLDHDVSTNEIETSSVCYTDADLDDPNAEPREPLPGEGPDALPGPPGPPPYGWQQPAPGSGAYGPGTGNGAFTAMTCYPELGGLLGPNAIVDTYVVKPFQQLDGAGLMTGQLTVYPRQGSAQCGAESPVGSPIKPYFVDFYPIDDVNGGGPNSPAPWRTLGDQDFDNDGCTDLDELLGTAGCGDDPYNPYDLPSSGSDVSGNYRLVATVADADACWAGTFGAPPTPCSGSDGSIVPGTYHICLLDLQQAGTSLTARTYCYIDSLSVAVNPQVAGSASCPPAGAQYCGDGLVGAAPPGRTVDPGGQINFGDVDDQHAVLAGQLSAGRILLSGCIEDRDGFAALGHIHVTLDVDAHTGLGDVVLAPDQLLADCTGGTPSGSPPASAASMVRLALPIADRDNDGDGCPDRRELSDGPPSGGLRDPFDHYDYFNPTQDGINRVDDILAVVNQYFFDDPPGQPDFASLTDRTAITGANVWNLGPPNGLQRVDDILSAVKQYFHDC